VGFELAGQPFIALSAGAYFKLNPAISLIVSCSTAGEVDKLWAALSEGGTEMKKIDLEALERAKLGISDA